MRKRIIIISVMIGIVIIACAFEIIFVNNISSVSSKIISDMKETCDADESSDVSDRAAELYELWQKNIPLLSAFIQHQSIDEIEESVAIIKIAAEKNDVETLNVESARAIVQIQSLRDTEFPYGENIF